MADLFVSSSPSDSAFVDRCVAWLRTFGVTVCVAGTDDVPSESTPFRAAAFFLSHEAFEDAAILRQIHTVATAPANRPVLLLLLEDIGLNRVRSLPVLDVQSLNIKGMTPAVAGEALVKLLPSLGVLRAPLRTLQRTVKRNEFRKDVVLRSRLRWAAIAVIFLSLAWLIRSKLLTAHASVANTATQPPVLVVPEPPTPKAAPLITPNATPKVVEQTPPVTMPTREQRAVEFVQQFIASLSRENGMIEGQIERIVAFFAEPTFIEDKGLQSRTLIRFSMLQRSTELPKYHEAIKSITVQSASEPSTVKVLVKLSYFGENTVEQSTVQGGGVELLTVTFGADDQPLLTRMEFPNPKN